MLLERPIMDASNVEAATFTSIGKLGVSRRSHERLYVNATCFSSDPNEFDRNFRRLVEIGRIHEQKIGRIVFRGLVSKDVLDHVLRNDIAENLEVALPVGEFTGDDSWLVYMSKNKPGREQISSCETMIKKTTRSPGKEIRSPVEKVKSVFDKGFFFTERIAEDQIDQVLSLWGETFGWKREDVENLHKKLDLSKQKPPSQRDVWFSAATTKDGRIVSLAMAERLSIPGEDGKALDLVESTEWRTDDAYPNNGLMTGTLDMLNSQILSDLKDSPNGAPLIFAECNFQVRADLTGKKAEFNIPQRIIGEHLVPQILVQNVSVCDGSKVGGEKLRDFTFMYLPQEVIQQHYNPMQVEEMKNLIAA